jgi:hypothetical protein
MRPHPEHAPAAKVRRARNAASLAIAALLAAGVLAGCGSSDNGITSKTPQEILQASKTAVQKAGSVTIHSNSAQGPLKLTSDLKLTRESGQGTISLLSLRTEVIKIGGTVYFKGSPALYRRLEIKPPPAGTWIKAPATGNVAPLAALTNLAGEATRIISTSGKITKGATTTIEGQPALELKTEGKLYKGRLYIKTTGEPYPLKLEKTGRETSHTTFTNWNNTPPPTAPTNTTTMSG